MFMNIKLSRAMVHCMYFLIVPQCGGSAGVKYNASGLSTPWQLLTCVSSKYIVDSASCIVLKISLSRKGKFLFSVDYYFYVSFLKQFFH